MDSLVLFLALVSIAHVAPTDWDLQNAESLVSGDPKTPIPSSRPDEAPRAKVALAIIGKRLNFGEPNEHYWGDYEASMKWFRECRIELEGTPPSEDLRRFPSRDVVKAHLVFSHSFVTHLTERYSMYLDCQPNFFLLCEEIRERREMWNLLDTAHLSPTVWHRRRMLDRLRNSIGPERYSMGVLPFPVPDEAFHPFPNWGGTP